MNKNNELLEAALELLTLGYSPIPIIGKKSSIAWKPYQTQQPTEAEVREWFNNPEVTGVAVVTGKRAGIFVFDVEKEALNKLEGYEIPTTVSVATGGEGEHHYFQYPDFPVKNHTGFVEDHWDIRGEGGYVVIPPSGHPEGGGYQWKNKLGEVVIANAPDWMLEALHNKHKPPVNTSADVPESRRNDEAVRVVGSFLGKCHTKEEIETVAWPAAKEWNQEHCKPPLPETQLRTTFDFYAKKQAAKFDMKGEDEPRESKAKVLLELVLPLVELFHDQFKEGFARIKRGDHYETYELGSSDFKDFLRKLMWESAEKAITSEDINGVVGILSAMAKFDKGMVRLSNRIAYGEGQRSICYDLANAERLAVEITASGWRVMEAPNMFRRPTTQAAQVMPLTSGGDIRKICKYLNIKNDEQLLLFLVYLVYCFVPDSPHPIIAIHGPPGSAKSSFSRIVKTVVDPSCLGQGPLPSDLSELIQMLSHHWCLFFDNVSRLNEWSVDCLCRAVTGEGQSKRKLYTNDEDKVYNFQLCIGINGVNLVANRGDVLERCVIIELQPIDPSQRLTEKELKANFAADLPSIMGGIFDTLAKAISIQPSIKLTKPPRMADFTEWGCAIAEALGHTQKEFLDAYEANRQEQHEQVATEDIVAAAILTFMQSRPLYEGTPAELYDEIEAMYGEKKPRNLPRVANTFSQRLKNVRNNLEAKGILAEHLKDTAGRRGRFIRLSNTAIEPSQPSLPSLDDSELQNSEIPESSQEVTDVSHEESAEPSDSIEDDVILEMSHELPHEKAVNTLSDGSDSSVQEEKPLTAFQKIMTMKKI